MKCNVVELFSGVGGLGFGFNNQDCFNVLMANEYDKDIAKAYSINNPEVKMLCCDISDLTEEMLKETLGDDFYNVDMVIGGPPCQSYSTVGKRKMDSRANLFLEYKRVLSILDPQMFLFENVEGILSMDKGRLFQRVKDAFKELGYELKHQVLDAADFGIPQHRKRLILVGMKGQNDFQFPKGEYGEGRRFPYISIKEALEDLPPLKSGESKDFYIGEELDYPKNELVSGWYRSNLPVNSKLTEHKFPRNNDRMIKVMESLKDGQTKDDLPGDICPKSGYKNTYAKLWWDRPSTTITRNFACPSSSRCIHPRDSRALSIREGARLQSFPDDYVFYGSDGKKRLEIGNAVPPLLSMVLANSVADTLISDYE